MAAAARKTSRTDTSPAWALPLFLGRLSSIATCASFHWLEACSASSTSDPHPFPDLLLLCYRSQVGEERVCRQATVRGFMEKNVVPEFSMEEQIKMWKRKAHCSASKPLFIFTELEFYQLTNCCYLSLLAYVLFKRRG